MKHSISRRQFLKSVGASAAALTLSGNKVFSKEVSSSTLTDKRPNILFIYSDDHAAPAISAYPSFLSGAIKTPNLDRLAQEGMRFDNAFCTNSICTPARATVLTGKYSHKNGALTLDVPFDGSQQTFPKMLQKAGYYTAIVGKWHLGTEPTGFDYYNVLPGQGAYFNPKMKEITNPWKHGFQGGMRHEGYVTDIITDIALETLKNRPKDKPFCMMYQHKAPHDMFEYTQELAKLYQEVDITEPDNLYDDYQNRSQAIKRSTQKLNIGEMLLFFLSETQKENFTNILEQLNVDSEDEMTDKVQDILKDLSGKEKMKHSYQAYIKAYLRCVASIDDNMGRVLKYLDDEGLAESTIVIYTSDQGFFLGEHGMYDKRFMYEESLRIPLLVRYPLEIKADSVNKDIITNCDFAATFLDYAGVSIPDDIQGRSLRPLFKGKTPNDWRRSMYYRYWMHRAHYNVSAHYGIRTHRFKLIFYYGLGLGAPGARHEPLTPEWELFDLEKDPAEMKNVYDDPAYEDIVKGLKVELLELKDQLGDKDEKYPELMEVRKKYW
ncbi:MAG: sulfatase/phosphatase domain-containing protein [Planctomycetota bacterium]